MKDNDYFKPKDLADEVKSVREVQINFTYYIVGLAVASIGFGVNQTVDKNISWPHGILLLSIISFLIAVVSGLSYIRVITASMNHDIMLHQRNNLIIIDTELSDDEKYLRQMLLAEEWDRLGRELTKKNIVFYRWQRYSFVMGIALFVVWRLVDLLISNF